MKDQYVADVNDYLKYALLRRLAVSTRSLVVWMLTPPDERSDGARLSYLSEGGGFSAIDPDLFSRLRAIARSSDRTVRAVEATGVLPDATFVSAILPRDPRLRAVYFGQVVTLAAEHALVFFDPDNGLSVPSVPKGRKNSDKYLYWDELASIHATGCSTVVYQHFPRRNRAEFLASLEKTAVAAIGCRDIIAVTTAHVAFLIVPNERDASSLRLRAAEFVRRAHPLAGFHQHTDPAQVSKFSPRV